MTMQVLSVLPALTTLIDELFTSDDERAAAKLKLLELEASGALAQLEVNKAEAGSGSVFVAGWRPAVGWTCAAGLAYTLLLRPLLAAVGYPAPEVEAELLLPILMGMMGLRSFEKHKQVATTKVDRNW